MAVELNRCIFDPLLVKPKCVWETVDLSKNCKPTAEICKLILKIEINLPPLKRILALPTKGLKYTVSVPHPFTFDNFQLEHLVFYGQTRKMQDKIMQKWYHCQKYKYLLVWTCQIAFHHRNDKMWGLYRSAQPENGVLSQFGHPRAEQHLKQFQQEYLLGCQWQHWPSENEKVFYIHSVEKNKNLLLFGW